MQVNVYIVENDVIRKWEDISPSEQVIYPPSMQDTPSQYI